jgi:hypothetical protein
MDDVRKWFRQQGFVRSAVDDATRDAIVDAERQRIAAWVGKRAFSSTIEVDDGCNLIPEGVTITVHVGGVERAQLEPLFEDIDLDGSLRRVFVEPDRVRLVFVPLRSTDVYDIALRRLEELLKNEGTPKNSPQGPYR